MPLFWKKYATRGKTGFSTWGGSLLNRTSWASIRITWHYHQLPTTSRSVNSPKTMKDQNQVAWRIFLWTMDFFLESLGGRQPPSSRVVIISQWLTKASRVKAVSEHCRVSKEGEIALGFLEAKQAAVVLNLLGCTSESPRKVFRNYQSPSLIPEPLSQSLGDFEKVPRLYLWSQNGEALI